MRWSAGSVTRWWTSRGPIASPATLAEEDREGTSRAYLSHCPAEQLINWATDERGDFEWVVIRTKFDRKPSLDAGPRSEQTRWIYYDRRRFQIYRAVDDAGPAGVPATGERGRARVCRAEPRAAVSRCACRRGCG